MGICFKRQLEAMPLIMSNGDRIEPVTTTKLLGVTLCDYLGLLKHIEAITGKA